MHAHCPGLLHFGLLSCMGHPCTLANAREAQGSHMQQYMNVGAEHLLLQHLFLTSAALPAGLLRSHGRGRED